MTDKNRWLMPEGIEEMLPAQAERVERLRRRLLDLFHSWGYELVMPPLIEYVESLLIGRGDDLDLQTFKLTDQLNGRLMGVRADITPQVARIDAHHLKRECPTRLCYVGSVLNTRQGGFAESRQPLQVGAELYGHSGIDSDVEVLLLMVETLTTAGIKNAHVDLGHVGIFRSMASEAGLSDEQEIALFDVLQRKAKADMELVFAECGIAKVWRDRFMVLVDLNGDEAVLSEASQALKGICSAVENALGELQNVATAVKKHHPSIPLHFDLAELRGYHYKTGVVFATFVPGHGQEVGRGGRYDEIGRFYGRPRPAAGFSTDLKTLIRLSADHVPKQHAILAPDKYDDRLYERVRELRAQGERVITLLKGQQNDPHELGCDRELVHHDGSWQVRPLGAA